MGVPPPKEARMRQTQIARTLRKNLTETEVSLWKHLRGRQLNGHKFRRQHPIGPYIVDFVCLEKHLVIEVDGGQHNDTRRENYDNIRTAWLESQGFQVIRFWNNQVLTSLDAVKESIICHLESH